MIPEYVVRVRGDLRERKAESRIHTSAALFSFTSSLDIPESLPPPR
jgi:hypothetical protein